MQKLPLGAKESDIILPDTLEVKVEEADETLAQDSQNVHLVEAVDKGTEKDTDAETAVWQISGITWKLDEEQSDLPEFHGGISSTPIPAPPYVPFNVFSPFTVRFNFAFPFRRIPAASSMISVP